MYHTTKSFTMRSALAASALLLAISLPATHAYTEEYNGCYSDSTPLQDQGTYTYQSDGYCQKLCLKSNYAVFALHNGQDCLCGNELPAASAKVSDSKCNIECAGWPSVDCGGSDTYSVYLTGIESDVDNYSASSTTTSSTESETSTSTTQQAAHVVTSSGTTQTVYATAASETEAAATAAAESATDPAQKKNGSSANTAAIAAGVVVGVVGACALAGAGFFLWRFKNRKAQYRRSIGVDNYGNPMSQHNMSDSRFDGDFMAQRRQSNGSIDDDQDFSRRILQVTNPDRR